MKNILYYLLGPIVFTLVVILLFVILNMGASIIGYFPPTIGNNGTSIYAFIVSAVPLLFGFMIARSIASVYSRKLKLSIKPLLKRNWVAGLLLGTYLLTWAVGGPAVQNDHTRWAIEEHAGIREKAPQGAWTNRKPYVSTYVIYPVLPFILISYHEYQIAPVYGLGSWDVHCWYITGVKRIFHLPIWIS
jgi:hypothetical protein